MPMKGPPSIKKLGTPMTRKFGSSSPPVGPSPAVMPRQVERGRRGQLQYKTLKK